MQMLNFLVMILICTREMMVPENGGVSVKKGKNLYGIIFLTVFPYDLFSSFILKF
jgi:hypothetical protein